MAIKWMLIIAAVLASIPPTTARAQKAQGQEMTAAELLNNYRRGNKAAQTTAAFWLNGFIGGVMVSSIHAEQNGKPIICPHDAVVIGQEFVIENMERLVRERPDLKTRMWQFVAFTALREAFPCK